MADVNLSLQQNIMNHTDIASEANDTENIADLDAFVKEDRDKICALMSKKYPDRYNKLLDLKQRIKRDCGID